MLIFLILTGNVLQVTGDEKYYPSLGKLLCIANADRHRKNRTESNTEISGFWGAQSHCIHLHHSSGICCSWTIKEDEAERP